MKTLSRILAILGLSLLMPLCEGAPVPRAATAEAAEKPGPINNTSGTCLTVVGHFASTGFYGQPAYWLPDFSVNHAQGPIAISGGSAIMVTNPNLYGFTIGYIHTANWRFASNYHITSYPYSLAMVPASDVGGFPYACTESNLVPNQVRPPADSPKPSPEVTNTGQTCVFVSYGAITVNQLTEFSVNTGVVHNIMVESLPQNPPGSVTFMEVYSTAYGWTIGWVGHDTVSYIPLVYNGHFYAPAVDLHGGYTLIEANHGMSYPFTCPSGMFP